MDANIQEVCPYLIPPDHPSQLSASGTVTTMLSRAPFPISHDEGASVAQNITITERSRDSIIVGTSGCLAQPSLIGSVRDVYE